MKHFKIIIILCCILIIQENSYSQNQSIELNQNTLDNLFKTAKKNKKLVFLEFYGSLCGHCKYIHLNVFTNDTVAKFYNNNFIYARIDTGLKVGKEIARKYEVNELPYLLFLDRDGNVVHREIGTEKINNNSFVEVGLTALNPYKNYQYYKNKYQSGKIDVEFISKYLIILKNLYIDNENVLDDYFSSQKELELTALKNWNIIKKYVFNIDSKEFRYLLNNKEKFIEKYSAREVNEKIYNVFLNACYSMISSEDFDIKKYDTLKIKIKKTNYYNAEKIFFLSDLQYYRKIKDWNNFSFIACDNVEKYYRDNSDALNNFAWDFYLHIEDNEAIKKAAKWAKRSIDIKSSHFNNDTYAGLLFKLGNIKEAIQYEKKAIKLAKESGISTSQYKKMIKMMEESR